MIVTTTPGRLGFAPPARLHAHLFARGIEACGLRSEYGAYIDEAPLEVLEQNNAAASRRSCRAGQRRSEAPHARPRPAL